MKIFHGNVGNTKDWVSERNEALNSDDIGKGLGTVQALQGKHKGLERDLTVLDKINQLDERESKLRYSHSESSKMIYEELKDNFKRLFEQSSASWFCFWSFIRWLLHMLLLTQPGLLQEEYLLPITTFQEEGLSQRPNKVSFKRGALY